ncbi:hypothetical protein [Gordonia crocea]|uniref:Membrane protein n=1 Tax=Gordonia crocea TaxID=589162 RepID=A0A7M3SU07_9ACTN|nr:hypothetical protein [Gordonia crocea]GED96131.1 membrane protein [Gordonia crocea]
MSSDSAGPWVPPNIDPAATPDGTVDPEWRPVGPTAFTGPDDEPVAHIPSLPGVDLPTRLPEPQPEVTGGLDAHKPGVAPLRPLGFLDIISGSVGVIRGNLGIVAVVWACVWIPVVAVVVAGLIADAELGRILVMVAALVVPVVVTGMLAAPMTATAVGRPLSFRESAAVLRSRMLPRLTVDLTALAVLAAPAIVVGLLISGITRTATAVIIAVVALPVFYAVPLALYLLLSSPILMAQTVVAVEGAPLGASIRRALVLTGRGLVHQLVPIGLAAVMFSAVGSAVLGFSRLFGLGGTPMISMLVAAAVLSPVVAGFAALAYVDARIRQEGLDVELLAGDDAR